MHEYRAQDLARLTSSDKLAPVQDKCAMIDWRGPASGAFAATAALAGKFAFAEHSAPVTAAALFVCSFVDGAFCWVATLLMRAIFVGLLVFCNGLMLSLYLQAMHSMGSLNATVTNSAANFLLSGAYGVVLFNETASPMWGVGATLILLGVFVLASTNTRAHPHQSDSPSKRKE